IYFREARRLGREAAEAALKVARVRPEDLSAVLFVSTTGLATPSLDSWLIKDLNLSRHTTRLPVWGLGCAGGVGGLNRAADLSLARDGRPVLLVAVELCSLTFQPDDDSKSNLIATSLFSDGAAAVILGAGEGPTLLGGHSTLFDGTEDIMGWDVNDAGL
ncbi:MAG TPA: chalcone synthase, partial [Deinococcales bacterium]|nr:chalcone synthase [Deinococcales bacterium]